jgi:hypothetical protein
MIKSIYRSEGTNDIFLKAVDDQPVCGEHFCESCGDCLACAEEWDSKCIYNEYDGSHFWVEYDGEQK